MEGELFDEMNENLLLQAQEAEINKLKLNEKHRIVTTR